MAGQAHDLVERCGARGGVPAIYLHGVPGAVSEARLIEARAREAGVELWAIDRSRLAPQADGEAYLSTLAETIDALGRGQRLPVIGFSIGAALTLRAASRLGDHAGPLFLISAAGPLDMPGAFEGMGSGARVFRTAQARGIGLDLLVRFQTELSCRTPGVLRRLLFAGADPADRDFAAGPFGRRALTELLSRAWVHGGRSYRRDLLTYTDNWWSELAHVTAEVTMWHGTVDTWAPIAMARGIAAGLPKPPHLHEGATGHYTTLIAAARELLDTVRTSV